MNDLQAEKIANRVVNDILDKGLAKSTWRDKFPEAYETLLEYRVDMVDSVQPIIKKMA